MHNAATKIQKIFRGYRDRIIAEALKVEKMLIEQHEEFSRQDESRKHMVTIESFKYDHDDNSSPNVRVSNISNNMGWNRMN